MKKSKILTFILSICLILPAIFLLNGCKNDEEPTYTITFKNADGTIISENRYTKYGEIVIPETPTKPADNTYTYTFNGWDIQIPDEITEDLVITATYTATYIEYNVSFPEEDIWIRKLVGPSQTSPVTNSNTLHYGDLILICEIYDIDRDDYHVILDVTGATPTGNPDEYMVQGNVSVNYSKIRKVIIEEFENNITITKNGVELSEGDILLAGDIINIVYTLTPGYEFLSLGLNGATPTGNPNEYRVNDNRSSLHVNLFELISQYSLNFPSNLIVKSVTYNYELDDTDYLFYGDLIKIERVPGYEETTYIVNGATPTENPNEYQVTGNVEIVSDAIRIEYSFEAPEFLPITRDGITLTNQDKLYYGDILVIDFESVNHTSYDFDIDGTRSIGANEYKVIDNVVITQEYINLTIVSDIETKTYRLSTWDSLWLADHRGDFDIDYLNSIGFYADSDFKNNISNDTTFSEDTTVYTMMATLDKLELSGDTTAMTAEALNNQISGTIVFPRNVHYIKGFMWTGITSVIIPENVRTIHSNAFAQCSSLGSITFLGNVQEIQETAFHNSPNLKTIIINNETFANSFETYNSNQRLLTYVETIYIAENIENISGSIYITENFTKQATSDKSGYDMYVKNS